MKKIPTLFLRDPNTRLVIPEFNPDCEWVLECKGYPTQKYDGVACMIHDGHLYKRHLAKMGESVPTSFIPAQNKRDSVTGELPGWVPVDDGPDDQYHREAFQRLLSYCRPGDPLTSLEGLTYELIGPNIQGNPEHYREHVLIPHGVRELAKSEVPTTYDGLMEYFATHDIEGIVWWRSRINDNCKKCKIKASDFGVTRGERKTHRRR